MPEPHPSTDSISRDEQRLWLLLFALLLIGYFLNLGVQPLYLEEPRRAIIAMEMLENQDWIVPTLLGQYYYNKPPAFNWLLLASVLPAGSFSEWTLRLPTVLSTLLLGALIYGIGRRRLDERSGRYAAAFWLCSFGVLYYFSTLAEIDLFFSLLTFSGMYAIYYWYQKDRLWPLFLTVYLLTAIAFLSKSLPALVFTAISLLVFFIWKKQFRKLFHPAHFTGIGLLALLVGGYFYLYAQRHPHWWSLLRVMWSQSSERTVAGSATLEFIQHLVVFPFEVLKELAPALFLFPFLIRKKLWVWLKANDFLFFCTLLLLFNLLPYWLSPGTRMRYLYMLLPFGIFILTGIWQQTDPQLRAGWRARIPRALAGLVIILLPLGSLALPLVPDLDFLPYRLPLALGGFVGFGAIALGYFRRPQWSMLWLLIALAGGRILFDLTVLPQRAVDSGAQRNQAFAKEIYEIVGDAPLEIVCTDKILSYTSTFYLNRLRGQVLRANEDPRLLPGRYYIISVDQIPASARLLRTWEYEDAERALIWVK